MQEALRRGWASGAADDVQGCCAGRGGDCIRSAVSTVRRADAVQVFRQGDCDVEGEPVKTTQLRRRKPLRRSRSIRKRIPRRVQRMTAEDRAYRDWVHRQPCVGIAAFPPARDRFGLIGLDGIATMHVCCEDSVQQSHDRAGAGVAMKAPERRSVAMCHCLHREWEEHTGRFAGWSKEQRRAFMNNHIAEANAKFDREHGAAVRPEE